MMLPVSLSPKPGFCIKSTALSAGVIYPSRQSEFQKNNNKNLLEPPNIAAAIPIPPNRKVFVNIAWDAKVPPPPDGSEDAIQRAIQGEDQIDEQSNPNGWYVPVIVSDPREDKDKAGNPSVVVDCVFNTSVKSRTLRDPEFKLFLIELSLQRIEAQTGLTLSRSIGTPNIASKGKLLPRTVQIPASMLKSDNVNSTPPINTKDATQTPLIQELSSSQPGKLKNSIADAPNSLPGLRGILKTPSAAIPKTTSVNHDEPLFWTWSTVDIDSNSTRIKLQVHVPNLTVPLIASSALHISPRTLELSIPDRRLFLIDLSLSDAEIASRIGTSYSSSSSGSEAEARKRQETTAVLQLKKQRDFDVDRAEAEWKIGTGTVEIYV